MNDVLSGKRGLPKLDNYMKVVAALVAMVGNADVVPWREAWVRVKQEERGLRRASAMPPRVVSNLVEQEHGAGDGEEIVHDVRERAIRKAEDDVRRMEATSRRPNSRWSAAP
ncbi:hypothetical protein [Paractinoplanes deccanensis]|uniref:hypothetical protein n=1 Tax=Paractinoplanes deccanensis TaxID=113561 RepID=UPI00194499BA|nr:hypothetical protein [Actinoplanes deccanensis]